MTSNQTNFSYLNKYEKTFFIECLTICFLSSKKTTRSHFSLLHSLLWHPTSISYFSGMQQDYYTEIKPVNSYGFIVLLSHQIIIGVLYMAQEKLRSKTDSLSWKLK